MIMTTAALRKFDPFYFTALWLDCSRIGLDMPMSILFYVSVPPSPLDAYLVIPRMATLRPKWAE